MRIENLFLFVSISLCVYEYIWHMCVIHTCDTNMCSVWSGKSGLLQQVCACMCAQACLDHGGQRKTLGVLFYNSLTYSFETQSFSESGVRLTALKSQHIIFVPTLLWLQAYMTTPGFLYEFLRIQTQGIILVQPTVFLIM